jgi:hypothetical protein
MRRLRVGALWLRGPGRESTGSGQVMNAARALTDHGTVELQCLVY